MVPAKGAVEEAAHSCLFGFGGCGAPGEGWPVARGCGRRARCVGGVGASAGAWLSVSLALWPDARGKSLRYGAERRLVRRPRLPAWPFGEGRSGERRLSPQQRLAWSSCRRLRSRALSLSCSRNQKGCRPSQGRGRARRNDRESARACVRAFLLCTRPCCARTGGGRSSSGFSLSPRVVVRAAREALGVEGLTVFGLCARRRVLGGAQSSYVFLLLLRARGGRPQKRGRATGGEAEAPPPVRPSRGIA